MIGLDTNVLVRYITQDDPLQAAAATRVIEALTVEEPGYLTGGVLVETYWVLRTTYGFSREDVVSALGAVVAADEFVVENETIVRNALILAGSTGADFADAVIVASCRHAGCADVVTFDKNAAKSLGVRLLS